MTDDLTPEQLAKLSTSELANISSQMKERLQNDDWKKMLIDLQKSGHIHTFHEDAPPLLQRFLKLEVDLESELSRQSRSAPLMSSLSLDPRRPRGDERRLLALMATQDAGATMRVEVYPNYDTTVFSYSVGNMLTLRFELPKLDMAERQAFLEMARRDMGISVLWTPERWNDDYIIVSKGEFFSRIYAFSGQFEATARMSAEVIGALLDWLERCWFPRDKKRRAGKRATQMLSTMQVDPAVQQQVTGMLVADSQADETIKTVIEQLKALDEAGVQALKTAVGAQAALLDPILKGLAQNPENIAIVLSKQPDLFKSIQKALPDIKTPSGEKTDNQAEDGEDNPFEW